MIPEYDAVVIGRFCSSSRLPIWNAAVPLTTLPCLCVMVSCHTVELHNKGACLQTIFKMTHVACSPLCGDLVLLQQHLGALAPCCNPTAATCLWPNCLNQQIHIVCDRLQGNAFSSRGTPCATAHPKPLCCVPYVGWHPTEYGTKPNFLSRWTV